MEMFKIEAYSYAEAVEVAAKGGMKIIKNVTQSYKNANCPAGADLAVFGESMLEKNKIKDLPGVGVMVVLDGGSPDVRERPYTFENNVNEGTRTSKRVFVVRTAETDRLVGKAYDKDSAVKLAKAAMVEVKEDMVCTIAYEVSNPEAFTLKYTPSKNTNLGTYIVFGTVAE